MNYLLSLVAWAPFLPLIAALLCVCAALEIDRRMKRASLPAYARLLTSVLPTALRQVAIHWFIFSIGLVVLLFAKDVLDQDALSQAGAYAMGFCASALVWLVLDPVSAWHADEDVLPAV